MRATVNGIEVEGTPSEIAEFLRSFEQTSTSGTNEIESLQGLENKEDSEGISEAFAYRVLKRIPLSRAQKELLLFLRDAKKEWVRASEVLEHFDWTGPQLGGVLGGLGRRVTATKGYERGYDLWLWRWDEDEGEYTYSLPQATVDAMARFWP